MLVYYVGVQVFFAMFAFNVAEEKISVVMMLRIHALIVEMSSEHILLVKKEEFIK